MLDIGYSIFLLTHVTLIWTKPILPATLVSASLFALIQAFALRSTDGNG